MTTQHLIDEIIAKNPQISQAQIMANLEDERTKTGGLLTDETLLRLIAAKLGVQVQQTIFQNNSTISSGKILSGLYDVSVAGRLVAVFPVKTFQGQEKSGKFATLILGDNDGLLRVILWNEKAELIEKGELRSGQAIKLLHGYTKDDRYGKTELHMSGKSLIEPILECKAEEYPPIEKFVTKIGALNINSVSAHIVGTVKAIFGKNVFPKSDDTNGVVMRLAFRDDSGEAMVVVWNEKVEEIERALRDSAELVLVNARVKETQNGAFEIHVDSNTVISTQKK
jgi:replication factor A1